MPDTRKMGTMGRRRFIETLKGLGVSATAAVGLSQNALANLTDNPEEEVPVLYGYVHTNQKEIENGQPPKREPKYYTISRDKWTRIEAHRKAAKLLADEYSSYRSIEVGVGSDGKPENHIVEITYITKLINTPQGRVRKEPEIDFQEVEAKAPDELKVKMDSEHVSEQWTVDVQVQKNIIEEQAYFDSRYGEVPGGCEISPVADSTKGTVGTPAYDTDYDEYVHITAAHLVDNTKDVSIYQPYSTTNNHDYIGDSRKISNTTSSDGENPDIATIMDSSNNTHKYNIADHNGNYAEPIYGTVSSSHLYTMKDQGDLMTVQGRTTGRHQGPVLKISSNDWNVTIDATTDGGDSGGTYFVTRQSDTGEEYADIAGIHAWGVDADGDGDYHEAKGNVMDTAEGWLNVTI